MSESPSNTNSSSPEFIFRPPLHPASFDSLRSDRLDETYVYESDADVPAPDVVDRSTTNFRYKLTVVDRHILPTTPNLQFPSAVFIVPPGREAEYLFSSSYSLRQTVAPSAKCCRLIVVTVGRKANIDDVGPARIQQDLQSVIQLIGRQGRFVPKSLRPQLLRSNTSDGNMSIPIMAAGEIAPRNVVAQGSTAVSGEYVVEQVKVDRAVVRRLYFLDNPLVIQSEVVLADEQKEGDEAIVDKSQVAFEYQKACTFGLVGLKTVMTSSHLAHFLLLPVQWLPVLSHSLLPQVPMKTVVLLLCKKFF